MEKESYSIDDILSEVKKRREEQENALKTQASAENNKKTEEKKEPKTENKKASAAQKASEKKITAEKEPVKKMSDSEKKKDSKNVKQDKSAEARTSPKAETIKKTKQKPQAQEEFKISTKQNKSVNKGSAKENKANGSGEMIDILKIAEAPLEEPLPQEPEKERFFKTKKGKIVRAVIIILVLLIAAAGIFAVYFVNNMLDNLADDEDDDVSYQAVEYYNGMDFLQEDFPMIEEQSANEVYSYKEYLKYWYQNGDPVRSSHVLNVLLIGEDTVEEEISDTSRADSAIIASVNVDTGVIHLTSVLRDLFVYYEIDGEGHYGKINESAMGGMSNYINTLERYYKISIDNYAVVNFASFPKIIDALGGVDINITTREINEINNNPYVYGDAGLVTIEKTFEGTEGVMRLDGLQALAYCRIRHIDSDNVRADRQKAVLNELFNKAKTAGTLDTVKLVNQLSQYTKTGYTKKELISIGNTALRDGWLSFEIQTTNVPGTENSKGGENFPVYRAWIWLADIPKDAYELQQMIYGKSNIQLSENRPNYIAMGS